MQFPKNTLPVSIGAAFGAILISGLSLGNGWVLASSKVDTQIKEAVISTQASICASRAEQFLKQSNSTVSLEGYQAAAREKREDLAAKYSTPMQGQDSPDAIAVSACARLLNKPDAS